MTAGDFAWLGSQWPGITDVLFSDLSATDEPPQVRAPELPALAQLDALHSALPLLRLGWVYLVGPVKRGGVTRRVVLPLVERPVKLRSTDRGRRRAPTLHAEAAGPWDLSGLVSDAEQADRLERDVGLGGDATVLLGLTPDHLVRLRSLSGWVAGVVAAMGAPGADIVVPTDPRTLRTVERPVAVVGFGIHAALDLAALDLRSSLAAWSSRDPDGTALDALYVGDGVRAPGPVAADESPVVGPLVLSPTQERVVHRVRHEPVTVVSGPPGTGKSHTAAAVALDAMSRGERVLMATRSAEAADVLASLLERVPGPDPVLFGGGSRARRLAAGLAEGRRAPAGRTAADRVGPALARATDARAVVDGILVGIDAWERSRQLAAEVPAHRAVAPRWFEPDADLEDARARVERGRARSGRWRWWAGRALRRVQDSAGSSPDASLDLLGVALEAAALRRTASRAVPTVPPARWAELDSAETNLGIVAGEALREAVLARVESGHARAVAALSVALRAGRSQRRRHLRAIDPDWLTHALPLWIGTLGDIEELLPAVPAMFDLVVLDEASQIDQPAAAVALVRARRAVVIGDPRQLRFVSFVADHEVAAAIAASGVAMLADRLDVRRVSAFDLAAGVAPVTLLDEHHRGPPHLIGFSAHRFYSDRLTFATRHPRTEGIDCIDVEVVTGERDETGANPQEVDAVMSCLDQVVARSDADGWTPTVGVATPFRAQAEAILAGIRFSWTTEAIDRFHLRVGTVHAFQGDERDLMVVSLGVGPDGSGLTFLQDPNLFNVLITRARWRMVVLTSCPDPPPGLLRDYLRWSNRPPPAPPAPDADAVPASDSWSSAVADALRTGGADVQERYAVGRWTVDLCVGTGERAVGVECGMHPEGPHAHRRRHLALRRAGWRLVDAYGARFDGDPVAAAVDLAARASSDR